MKSSNPAFSQRVISDLGRVYSSSKAMSVEGTINKTALLFFVLLVGASISWNYAAVNPALMVVGFVGSLILAIATIFKPTIAAYTAPGYAFFEGLLLGALSMQFNMLYDGIVMNAVLLTIGVFAGMLLLYRTGAIKVTDKFRSIMMSMLMGVVIVYGLTFLLGLFGINVGIVTGNSLMAIGLNILIAGIAAFSLLLDFDMIERGSREQWPGYMEWYSAFGLMVTIVWLYLELLKLLSRFASRD
jgi:uncharacterized YccA/Bax inhibitor family protein